jgi:hypothetical protein
MSTSSKLDPTQYPGKQYELSKFNLALTIEPGSMINWKTWIPASQSHKLFDMPYETMTVEAWYDDTRLIASSPLSASVISINVQLPDDHEDVHHIITIKLSGKDSTHTFNYEADQLAVGMIKIKLYIEDLPINYCLEGQDVFFADDKVGAQNWAEFMGENGEQHIQISTPIYTWLVDNHAEIVSELKQLRN